VEGILQADPVAGANVTLKQAARAAAAQAEAIPMLGGSDEDE